MRVFRWESKLQKSSPRTVGHLRSKKFRHVNYAGMDVGSARRKKESPQHTQNQGPNAYVYIGQSAVPEKANKSLKAQHLTMEKPGHLVLPFESQEPTNSSIVARAKHGAEHGPRSGHTQYTAKLLDCGAQFVGPESENVPLRIPTSACRREKLPVKVNVAQKQDKPKPITFKFLCLLFVQAVNPQRELGSGGSIKDKHRAYKVLCGIITDSSSPSHRARGS